MSKRTWVTDERITKALLDTVLVTDVLSAEIVADAVTTVKILNANVTAAKLAANAVETAKIAALAVTEAKLAASSGTGLGALRVARAKYNFAVDGGAISTITLADNATLPDNAVIVGATINPTTAAVGATATIAFGTSAGSSATSLLAATAVASFSLDALINGVPTFAVPVKLTASGSITMTIAVAALTAGVIEVTLFYFVAAA